MVEIIHSKRIEFIDALRGVIMILIVLVHVAGFCFNIDAETPSIHSLVSPPRSTLPLFFFISGFVMYKEYSFWTISCIKKFFYRKMSPLILGTSVFFLSYLHLHSISIEEGILSDSKCGYWFTYTLFLYYVAYMIVLFLCRYYKVGCIDFIHLFWGACIYLLAIPAIIDILPISRNILNIAGVQHWGFYFFFVLGTLARKYYVHIEYYLDTRPVLLVCLCLFFLFNILSDLITPLCWNFFRFVTALTGIVIMFAFFRTHESVFRKDRKLGRLLQFIGRRTLDVYFIHYFLLPVNAAKIFTVFHDYPMPVIEYVVSLSITIAIIALCLLFGAILRLSPEISYWIFGVKKTSTSAMAGIK